MEWRRTEIGTFAAVALCVALCASAWSVVAATPTVAVEDIPATPADSLSARPGADGLIRNGDESTVERVFVYLDGCPMMEIVRPVAGTGEPELVILPADRDACQPIRGVSAGVPPGLLDGTAALAEDSGLHVRLFRENSSTAPRTDVERLTSPEGQSLIVDISSVDPLAQQIMARGGPGPTGPGGTSAFEIPGLPGEGGTPGSDGEATSGSAGPGASGTGGGTGPVRVSAITPPGTGGDGGSGRPGAGAGPGPGQGPILGPISAVPLPAGLGLMAIAVAMLVLLGRRIRRRSQPGLGALRRGATVSV
jgi:hypothetical protein